MTQMKQCLNVWPPVSKGRECLKECLRVRVSDLSGFRCLKEEKFGSVRVSVRVTDFGV